MVSADCGSTGNSTVSVYRRSARDSRISSHLQVAVELSCKLIALPVNSDTLLTSPADCDTARNVVLAGNRRCLGVSGRISYRRNKLRLSLSEARPSYWIYWIFQISHVAPLGIDYLDAELVINPGHRCRTCTALTSMMSTTK